MWIVGSTGIIASTLAICLGFIPPEQIYVGNLFFYDAFLVVGLLIMCGIPLIIFYQFRKPHWVPKSNRDDT